MARGRVILAALAAATVAAVATSAAGAKPRVVKRTVGATGATVPRSFAGLSIEYTSTQDYFGAPGAPNEAFLELLRTLGASGTGPPTIRLGGNSGDASWWNPDGRARPAGVDTDLTPTWLSTLRPVSEQTGARFVLGGNFAIGDPQDSVSYLQAAVGALPPGAIEAYELGNEADLYDRATTFSVGNVTLTRPQRRPVGYAVPQYLLELDRYVAALNAVRAPEWPKLAVGGFARHAWQVQAPAILAHVGSAAGFFQSHGYPLNRCRARHVRGARWRKALLGPTGSLPVGRARRLVGDVRKNGVAVRVSEINSATCGGAQGVSDSFASALWGADLLFGMADVGVAGVNFHTWTGAWYAPVYFGAHANPATVVRPLLYGMLLFDRAVQNGARLLRVTQLRNDPVKVWATRDLAKTVRVAVINKDTRRPTVVALKLPGGLGAGRLERLAAPSLDARVGVTFAGQSFERGAFDGRLHGASRGTRVKRRGRIYKLRLPAASAALLTARPRHGG
jgi:Glycosyl hydrolase family 79 C-terminal beta domain